MKNVSAKCFLLNFAPVAELSPAASAFLETYFEVVACNYTDDGQELWVCYTDESFDLNLFMQAAKTQNLALPPYQVQLLSEEDWLSAAVAGFDPVETADFCICSMHQPQPRSSKLLLRINAATAFGSGHQTTRLCLNAIGKLKHAAVNHKQILDMGTGSGILSLACAKIWQADKPHIVAADIDAEAVRVTAQNAAANDLTANLTTVCGDGFAAPEVLDNRPYDIIFANILARPLIEMAEALADCLAVGGFCVLSGFIDDQVDWVADAYRAHGLRVTEVLDMDNWHALIMEKKR